MQTEFEISTNELIEKLDITSVEKSFLFNAYMTSLPIMGSGEDEENTYVYLAIPTHQNNLITHQQNIVQGKTNVYVINKQTGQHVISEGGLFLNTAFINTNTLENIIGAKAIREKHKHKHNFNKLFIGVGSLSLIDDLPISSLQNIQKLGVVAKDERLEGQGLRNYFKDADVKPVSLSYNVSVFTDTTLAAITSNEGVCSSLAAAFVKESNARFVAFKSSAETEIGRYFTDQLRDNNDNYHMCERNFILGGEGKAKVYRQEFIDQCHQMIEQPQIKKSLYLLNSFYLCLLGYDSEKTIKTIDNGIFPLKEIGFNNSRKHLTKKQLKSAILDWKEFIRDNPHEVRVNLRDFILFSALPRNWLIKDQPNHNLSDFVLALKNKPLHRSLSACSEAIDTHKETGDKAALKSLAKEWSWLSSEGSETIDNRYKRLIDKNGGDHLNDYCKIFLKLLLSLFSCECFQKTPRHSMTLFISMSVI